MSRYFIQLSYFGKHYHGWQVQENESCTIQQCLQDKLGMLLQENIEITGCGRTDTGVHAEDYYAHFDSAKEDLSSDGKWLYRFNKILPEDIAIKKILEVKPTAHARFDAISRTYEYRIHQIKNAFINDFSLYHYGNLNIEEMNRAANLLLEVEDFTSFSKVNTQVKNNNCKVTEAVWLKTTNDKLIFKISANRFLRNMVRAIVGTLLEVGSGKLSFEEFKKIIESKNRSNAGFSVAAHGLYLTQVEYGDVILVVGNK